MNPRSFGEFHYKNNQLFCGDLSVAEVAASVPTPFFLYSADHFRKQYTAFTTAFAPVPHRIFYAVKSNFNLSVIRTFHELGSAMDVNSEGEFYRAEKAGVNPADMILTGVGKNPAEIRLGLERGVVMIKAESEDEIRLINQIAGEMGKTAPVAIRVNPDVDPQTHPYISTGLRQNKFGVNGQTALAIYKNRKEYPHLRFTGIDMHIGSQITSPGPYKEAVDKLADIYFEVQKDGLTLEHFDIGGGIGIQYNDESVFTPADLAALILPKLKSLKCSIFFEPGRFLTGNSGILVTKVLFLKNNENKYFIVVDAAMTDLLRPSIYKAYHHIQPVNFSGSKDVLADIVGPVCESGDFLAQNREIEIPRHEDLLAVMSAGAYGMVMSSNYNARRRATEVLADGNSFRIIRGRETFEHLLFDEEEKLNSEK